MRVSVKTTATDTDIQANIPSSHESGRGASSRGQLAYFEKENLFDITQCTDRIPQIRIAPKQPNEIKCANCGAVLEDGIRYCKYCGTTF